MSSSILYTKRFDTNAGADVSDEVTVPDYLPEIRRVIGVTASAVTDGKYLSADQLEADGGVTFFLYYTGADGEIACLTRTVGWSCPIPLGEGEEGDRYTAADLALSVTAENPTVRVTAPRRLSLAARVKLNLLSEKPSDASLHTEESVRRLDKTVRTASFCEVRQSAETNGELREREGDKIIAAHGALCLSDARQSPGTRLAIVKGDAYLTLLLLTPEGEYVTARSRAPIEETVPLPDACGDDAPLAAFGEVVMTEVNAEDGGILRWRMEYDLDLCALRQTDAEIAADAYLPGRPDTVTRTAFQAFRPAAVLNGRLTVSATMKLRPGMMPLTGWGAGSVEKAEVADGKAILGGNVRLTAVSVGGGEAITEDVTVPLRYEWEALTGAPDTESVIGHTRADVTDLAMRADGDTLTLTAELALSAALLAVTPVEAVTSVVPDGEAITERPNRIRVYVPDPGETAWDVEKRFRTGHPLSPTGEAYVI